jgi:colicin import membrane protein
LSGKRVGPVARRAAEESTMAERQETSVMVSIQEILRDAQSREEQEKVEAEQRAREVEQRRLEEIRRKQEEEAARLRAEEEERQRRAYEDQRRQAELQAMQEATIQRARAEAEAQARLAEIASRQEHERKLHALSQDKHKKRVQWIAIALGVFFFVGAIGAGVVIKQEMDKTAAAEAHARQLEADKEQIEQQQSHLKQELESTKDPQKIAALQQQLADQQAKLEMIRTQQLQKGPLANPGVAHPVKATDKGPSGKCNCTPGDPLCSCL